MQEGKKRAAFMTQNLMSAGVLVLAAPILLLGVADLSIFVQ